MSEDFKIRVAREGEAERIAHVEMSADERFATIPGFVYPADFTYPRLERYRESVTAGRVFVVVDGDDDPIGFAEVKWLGDEPYLGGLGVARAHQGNGLGRRLLAQACNWARTQGAQSLLLSTRRDIPWNAPFHARQGFVEIPIEDYTIPAIRERRDFEAQFQDMSLRMVMRKRLD